MGIFDPWAGFGITLHTVSRKTFTQGCPQKDKGKATLPRFHGRHQLSRWSDGLGKYVGCELYAWACLIDTIYVEGAGNTDEQRFLPGEWPGHAYQVNYLCCIFCGMCIEACPTCALTMTNEFKFVDKTRGKLTYEEQDLLAPLVAGMEQPPRPRRFGDNERAYLLRLPPTGRPDTRTAPEQGTVKWFPFPR